MATLVLTAVGTAIGGPIGGAIGALIGQTIDAEIFAPKPRQGPRLGDLSVQTSSYGTQIPKIFGTMRVAGTVIWATDIKEDKEKSGGGKGQPKTITYSYSASFAVAISGRPIRGVRRIWADGKLLRGASGDFKTETKYRLYLGSESQPVDPLIASAEGVGKAPAHRGIAYAVFEDLQLADFGNRIPSLTFEIESDAGPVTIGGLAGELSGGEISAEDTPSLAGYAASGDSIRAAVEALGEVLALSLRDDGARLILSTGEGSAATLASSEMDAEGRGGAGGRTEVSRRAAGGIPAEVTISYYDPQRDYQTGLQRATRGGPALKGDRTALAAALTADVAKAFAERRLARLWAAGETAKVSLTWRRAGCRPGDLVALPGRAGVWRVARLSVEHMIVQLELVKVPVGAAAGGAASPGRPIAQPDLQHGPTTLFLLDLPPVTDELRQAPLVLAAASGAEPGWRRAALSVRLDGSGWEPQGMVGPATAGHAVDALGPGGAALWDLGRSVEVELLNDAMWLESRNDAALAGGANAAMLGDELIQFGSAEPLGNRRFRLSRLLRGRRGTEWAAWTHSAGEPFVLLERERLAPIDIPAGFVGGELAVMASGIGDDEAPPELALAVEGRALAPPSPVHLRVERRAGGDLAFSWVRRSRNGWDWLSGGDAPLGEEREAYRLTLSGAGLERTLEVSQPSYVYTAAEQAEDGATAPLLLRVEQIGTLARSRPAAITID